jgi:hypothetical protein
MGDAPQSRSVANAMRRINEAWVGGRMDDMTPVVHPEIVMVFPGFTGRARGRDEFLAGFRGFVESATIHEFTPDDFQIDVIGATAVITFGYVMKYERSRERWRATGRDLWVFQRRDADWVAVWRTMLEMNETAD